MFKVKTNDGFIEIYNKQKIIDALKKDICFANEHNIITNLTEDNINKISRIVTRTLKKLNIAENDIINSDTIRGLVVRELYKLNEIELANIVEIIGIKYTDIYKIWQGDAYADNANMNSKAPEAQHKYIADKISKDAILKIFPSNIRNAHLSGRLWIHDLDFFATRPFCNEHDMRYYLYYGLYADGTGDNIPIAAPAQHLNVAVLHAAKALGSAQQFFAGGQGHQNFLTFLSPFMENMTYEEIKQAMQMYIWEMSQMLSRGSQACFSTTQLTPGVPEVFKNVPVVFKGKIWDGKQAPLKVYGDFEREVRLAFQAYTEVMIKGDMFGRPFSFPKYEIEMLSEHFNKDNWEEPFEDALSYKDLWIKTCELISKDGTPYIHNSLGAKKGSITCYSCCAFEFASSMHSDPKFEDKLYFRNGEHFILGSLQVCTLNLPQAAYFANGNIDKFVEYNKESINMMVEIFKIKKDLMNKQSLSFAKQTPIDLNDSNKRAPPLWSLEDLPCCIGIVGLNEAVENMVKSKIHESKEAYKLAVGLLVRLQIEIMNASKQAGFKIAFARTPAETTAQRFAICDLRNGYKEIAKKYIKGDIDYALKHLNENDLPIYYTNGAMICNDADVSLFEKMRLEEHAFSAFDGGNIFHIFVGESNSDPEGLLSFIDNIVHNTNIKYFAFTKEYSICKNCNRMIDRLINICPSCNSDDITQFSRVTGYIQAIKGKKISGWNKGKREELKDRKKYDEKMLSL
jgi:ribonucleoside-triphosphate reductase